MLALCAIRSVTRTISLSVACCTAVITVFKLQTALVHGAGSSWRGRELPARPRAMWSPRVLPAPPRVPCTVRRWCSAADPILSQGLKYSGFPAAAVSLSHSLTSSLLPSHVSPSGVRARCLFVPRKGSTAARRLVVRRQQGAEVLRVTSHSTKDSFGPTALRGLPATEPAMGNLGLGFFGTGCPGSSWGGTSEEALLTRRRAGIQQPSCTGAWVLGACLELLQALGRSCCTSSKLGWEQGCGLGAGSVPLPVPRGDVPVGCWLLPSVSCSAPCALLPCIPTALEAS